ncbi:MAG: outer membrane lipoprotein-sorting protein [Polyangia bacterium]
MTRKTAPVACALTALLVAVALRPPAPALAEAEPAAPGQPGFTDYVMRKLDDMYRGARSHAKLAMKVRTTHWTRTLSLESWSLGTEYSIVRITSPLKERGNATLKAEGELYTYLSKTGRTIKIASGMMSASWMGSHFTNDDLLRETRFSEDYESELIFEGEEEGQQIYRFELTPHADTPVVWGRIDVAVRASDLQPLSELFYDEDGDKMRLLLFSDHAEVGGRVVPRELTMRPLDGSGEYTELRYRHIDFNIDLDPGFFTVNRLESL